MEATRKPRLRQVDRSVVLPAVALDELVGPEHPVRAIWDYVGALDLTPLLSIIRAVEGAPGRNATDPRILVALWMWATSDGIGSARAVEKLCREHNAYRWLCGGVSLNYHTLASFRSSNEKVLDGFLVSHVSALLHEGLIDLSCVAQDGMRTRAGAGSGSFRRAASIEECEKLVQTQIAELKRKEDEPLDAVARRQLAAQKRHAEERAERLQAAEELGAKQEARRKRAPKETAERGTDPYASKKGDKAGMKALRARMKTAEAKELYKQRGETAEWVFAGMRQRGLSQFGVRGVSKVRAVALLHALVHNLWQTVRLLNAKTPGWNWTEILRAGRCKPQTA